jgi:cytochrome b6-f complex iron-sulfur subunit
MKHNTTTEPPRSTQRRQALRALGTAGYALVAGLSSTGGCSAPSDDDAPSVLRIPSGELPLGERVIVSMGGQPVELLRSESGVRAFSLICTHFSCVVRWNEADQAYVCPCHEGRYDSEGRVIAGPPPAPLKRIPLRLEQDAVVLGG